MTLASHVRLLAGAALLTTAVAGGAQRFGGGFKEQTGRELYEHVCQGCHMADARGAVGAGAYPSLAKDERLAVGLYPALVILKGQKAMPSFANLSDAQVAEVTNYVRTHFDNHYADPVSAADIKELRPQAGASGAFRPG